MCQDVRIGRIVDLQGVNRKIFVECQSGPEQGEDIGLMSVRRFSSRSKAEWPRRYGTHDAPLLHAFRVHCSDQISDP